MYKFGWSSLTRFLGFRWFSAKTINLVRFISWIRSCWECLKHSYQFLCRFGHFWPPGGRVWVDEFDAFPWAMLIFALGPPRTFLHFQPFFFLFPLLFCFVRFEEDKEKEGRGQSSCLHLSVVCSVCAKAAKCFPVLPESVFQTLQSMLAKKRLKYWHRSSQNVLPPSKQTSVTKRHNPVLLCRFVK